MQVSNIPLGTVGISQLERQLKELQRQLRDNIPAEVEVEVATNVATQVVANIPNDLRDLDGNYLGTLDGASSVSVAPAFRNMGHEVIWRGEQIKYVEFGTGASGARQPYPGVMAPGYSPDGSKTQWFYQDFQVGDPAHNYVVMSIGLTPQAPMYNASHQARMERWLPLKAKKIMEKRVRDALTVR